MTTSSAPADAILRVEATADVSAAPTDVYRLIADYRTGHPRIVPPRYFRNLRVEEGGYGAGTIIRFEMKAFGTTQHARAKITEPEPGRVLVETELENGAETTFIVDPAGRSRSRVTISTAIRTRTGVIGWVERAVTRSYLRRVYAAELARLEEQVSGAAATT